MKKMMKTLVFVAAAAMGMTACQNDFEEQVEAKDFVTVEFVAESADSRTVVDTSGDTPKFSWGANETFEVLEQTNTLAKANSVTYALKEGSAEISAKFDANSGQESYQYVAVYPKVGYVSAERIENATLRIPAEQTMAEGSYDPNADLMVSKVVKTSAQPAEVQPLRFTRLAAVAKMSFKGFADAAEKVESVTFTTAEGVNIAGTFTTDLTNLVEFTTADGVNSVTVTSPDGVSEVYFTLLPTTLEAGATYSVMVMTDKKIYMKSGTIAEGKSLTFAAGMVTRFGVDLSDATVSDKWVLVRNVANLEAGDIVTFVTKNQNWVIGSFGSYYALASYTEVVKVGDYFFHPVAPASEKTKRVQQFIVAPRSGKVNAFDFYNMPNEFTGDNYSGYICTYSTNNYLKHQETPGVKSLFYTTIDENGVATIEALDSSDTYKKLKYRAYNSGSTSSNRRFGCTNNVVATEHDDICIYKLAGVKGKAPVADAVITVPAESKPVVVAKEGETEPTAIDAVVFDYVGDWTIEVSDNADWLTVIYANEKLSYTALENEGEVRNATVTITASHDGKTSIVKTFKVVQKGVPQNVSVATFIEKPVDVNVDYRVTGILKSKATSSSGSTMVADANDDSKVATFKYIYLSDGKTTFYNNSADVKVGDVVTIVAPVTASKTGGSSDVHAIYEGYYNLSATAAADHVAYTGGDVKISIQKTGTLTPQTIKGGVSANFATLNYTDNATEATVTLKANDGAPREVVVTFTDGYATASVTIIQGADTSKGNTWELVTDASTLAVGDQVIIAAKDYDVAMSTTISSDKRSAIAVTKLGNYYLTPAVGTQTFILGAGTVDGTFAFYDADKEGFLVSSNTSAELINQAYNDAESSFAISIADGTATIANKEGDYSNNKLSYYYNSATSNYFCSSNSTTTTYKPLSLYRLVGVKGIIPVVAADVTANDAVISDAAATAIAIPEVVFNYVGDWTITATSDAEWLTALNYDKTQNCLTYTADANTGVARTAMVTITASLAGQSDITWEFELLQKGYTPVMTIAEYNAIPVSDRSDSKYMRYQMTGRIESIESVSAEYAKFTMTDGTAEVQVYGLETEDGEKDYGDFDLKVGDVVTITAPRFKEYDTAGRGSNNPAYYLSHYNIAATAVAAEYTAGSTAIISIATTSGLDVTYEMEACDFATIDYSADPSQENTTATVTFNTENTAEQARSVNVTFKTGLASITVTVTQKINPAKVKGWVLVTDASQLAVGDEVIIVAKNYNVALGCFTSSSTSTANKNKSEVEIVGNSITSEEVETKKVQKFTLVEGYTDNSFAFEFTYSSNTYYLYASSSGLVLNSSKASALRAYKIEIDADGKAAITSQGSTKYVVTYNYKTTTPTFTASKTTAALATDTEADVCIYKNSEKE